MSELFPLDQRDVEAVGRSRVSRAENKKTNTWMILSLLAIVAGVFVMNYSVPVSWGLCGAGVVVFFVYMNRLSRKQKSYTARLLDEWSKREEKK
jgi:hypothetical protein